MRTLFTYFFILILHRLMGKRELGKMSVFDVVISIMLAEMAVLVIVDVNRPAILFYLPMMLIAGLEIVMAFLSLKSKKIRDWIDGQPEMIMENGEIRDEAMRRNRLSMDDLLLKLRQKDVKSLADVEFAILETNGELSVFPKEQKLTTGLSVPLIIDGEIREEALQRIGQNKFWLKKEIRKYGVKSAKEVSFCSIDSRGIMFIDKKDPSRR
ncbi:DUF421 domain-containing protein [Brevibacillus ginsengisoli]|uniref:DUF421 domain-containing protein n=1 Tax=Brevibacillus ginsengisoli TaxID=363854 RepID=UPI003CEC87BC